MKIKIIIPILILLFNTLYSQITINSIITPNHKKSGLQFKSIVCSNFGNIYILEQSRHEIFAINNKGEILNKIGGYGWNDNNLNTPSDLCISSGLHIIVADYNNHRLVRYDRLLNFISTYPSQENDLYLFYPKSLAVGNNGMIFILENEISEIFKLDLHNEIILQFGGVEYEEYSIINPINIHIDEDDNILILEKSGRIVKYDSFGNPIDIISLQNKINPKNLIMIGNDFLVISDSNRFYYYSVENKNWKSLMINNNIDEYIFTDGYYIDDFLYLLEISGTILKCSIK